MPPANQGLFIFLKQEWVKQNIPRLVVIGLVYFLAGRLSYLFPDSVDVISVIWPASGISLAALLLSSPRKWPVILVVIGAVDFLTKITLGKSIPLSTGYMIANVLEPLLAAWFITRNRSHVVRFEYVSDAARLLGAAVFINGGSALIGAATAALGSGATFWSTYISWWVADGMGILLITPLIVTFCANDTKPLRTMTRHQTAELLLFMVAWCYSVSMLFLSDTESSVVHFVPYMVLPLLTWGAARFPPCVTATASVILAIVGVYHSDVSLGNLILGGENTANDLTRIQASVAVISMTAFMLSVSRLERMQVITQLRAVTQRLLLATSSARLGVWDWNIRDNILIWDDRMFELYGITREASQDTFKLWRSVVHPEDKESALAECQAALSGERELNIIFRIQHPDGTVKHIKSSGLVLRAADGKAERIIGIDTDISEQKNAEKLLLASKQKYKQLLDNSPAIVYSFSMKRGGIYYSSHAAAIMGYSLEHLYANPRLWGNLIHPEDSAMIAAAIAEFKTGTPFNIEYRIQTAQGNWLWFNDRSIGLREEDGDVIIDGMAIDITDRKMTEEQLRKLSLAVEQSPESIVITNIDGKIEYANEAFLRESGYLFEEVNGQNPRILRSGKTPQETYQSMWDALASGNTWKGEFYNRRKNGSEYTEFAIITPLRQNNGVITHYVAVKEDITEKKRIGIELDAHRHHLEEMVEQRTEELNVARHQAEAANMAKSAFLANMSHEIRTPMNAIVGLNHLMRRGEVTPEQTERLVKIDAAGQHLLAIINNILDLSKIEAGKLQLESTAFRLSSLLDQVTILVSESAKKKGLLVVVDYDAVPQDLIGDPTRLRQALLNYAANAIKFTENGTISLRVVLLERCGDELLVRFEVKDTGVGISPEVMARLFGAFEQADNSTTRKYGGTGLGLAIVKRLAQLMGGNSGVESTQGVGTTFWFTARLMQSESTVVVEPIGEVDVEAMIRKSYGGSRILIADDEPVNREIAKILLDDMAMVVDTVEDGVQAVSAARRLPYAAIFMDMQMPKLDGLEATRQIREIPGYLSTPIIAMTANAFTDDVSMCLAAGMNDFLAKPYNPNELYTTLWRSLNRCVIQKESGVT